MDDLALAGIGVSVCLLGFCVYGMCNSGDTYVTRDKEPVAKTELQALADGNYIMGSNDEICWCTLEGKEVKVMFVDRDYVKIIKDNENKVYSYNGIQHGKIMGVYHLKSKIKVYEIHTDKPIEFVKTDGLGKTLHVRSNVKTEGDNTEEVKFSGE